MRRVTVRAIPLLAALWLSALLAGTVLRAPSGDGRRAATPARVPAPHTPPTYTDPGPPPGSELPHETSDGIAFTGIVSTGFNPPDPDIAVGPDHVVLVVNAAIAVYAREGTFLWQMDLAGGGGFFGSLGSTAFIFDPEVVYDPMSDRFLLVVAERLDTASTYLFAISASGDAAGAWHTYRIHVSGEIDGAIDSPNIGVGPDAFYLAADFIRPDRFLITAIEKSSVLTGGTPLLAHHVHTGTHSFALPSQMTEGATHMYMLETFHVEPSSAIRLWAIEDPFGAFTLQSTLLTVPTYLRPEDIPSLETTTRARAFDGRLWSATYTAGSIFACHHASASPTSRVNEVRWYEVATNGWPTSGESPLLAQAGRLGLPQERFLSFPAIAADAEGNVMLVAARSASSEYFSVVRAFRRAGDPPGEMRGPFTVRTSSRSFGLGRWGDYLGMAADPTAPGHFFAHGAYVPLVNRWATWVSSHDLEIPVDVPTGAPAPPRVVIRAHPQPSTGRVTLSLAPGIPGAVLTVFDVGGRRVRVLDPAEAGETVWDGRDTDGRRVSPGVYLVRAQGAGRELGAARVTIVE